MTVARFIGGAALVGAFLLAVTGIPVWHAAWIPLALVGLMTISSTLED